MSLPGLIQGTIGVDDVPATLNEESISRGADAALTVRAIVVVTLAGAGFWYFLWKIALLFVAGH